MDSLLVSQHYGYDREGLSTYIYIYREREREPSTSHNDTKRVGKNCGMDTLLQWYYLLVPSMSEIDLFKNYLYSIGPCAKKKSS